MISIHAPHEGERLYIMSHVVTKSKFQSTLPTRGSDRLTSPMMRGEKVFQSTLPTRGSDRALPVFHIHNGLHFNPRSPRGGATALYFSFCAERCISIHAPHEGERPRRLWTLTTSRRISIHAPHEGERHYQRQKSLPRGINFNPRSPRGGATCICVLAFCVL